MEFGQKVLEALVLENQNLEMTLDDLRKSTIQEVLLYYTYLTIYKKTWKIDFDSMRNRATGNLEFEDEYYDIFLVAYLLAKPRSYTLNFVSTETKNDIVKYSKLYGIQNDPVVIDMMKKLNIIQHVAETRKKLIFDAHQETKNARNY